MTYFFTPAYYKACAKKIISQANNQKPMPNGVQMVGLSPKQMAAFAGFTARSVRTYISMGLIASIKLQEPVRDPDGTYYWRIIPLSEVLRVKRLKGRHAILGKKNPSQVTKVRRLMHTKGVAIKQRATAA